MWQAFCENLRHTIFVLSKDIMISTRHRHHGNPVVFSLKNHDAIRSCRGEIGKSAQTLVGPISPFGLTLCSFPLSLYGILSRNWHCVVCVHHHPPSCTSLLDWVFFRTSVWLSEQWGSPVSNQAQQSLPAKVKIIVVTILGISGCKWDGFSVLNV